MDVLKEAAEQCLGFHTLRAARAVARFYNDALKPSGLQGTQFSLLVAIRLRPGATLAQIAEDVSADATTLVRNIAVLRDKGLIHNDGPGGRGGSHITITPEGERAHDAAVPFWQAAHRRLHEALGRSEAMAILDGLHALEQAVGAGLSSN